MEHGSFFGLSPTPIGTFHTLLVTDKKPGLPADFCIGLAFDDLVPFPLGGTISAYARMCNEPNVALFNPAMLNRADNQSFAYASLGEAPNVVQLEIPGSPIPDGIKRCNTSYGHYFGLRLNPASAQFDDLQAVAVDNQKFPVNFRFLFVPVNWNRSQEEFAAAAYDQVSLLTSSTNLVSCPNSVQVELLDVATQNYSTFSCNQNDCNHRGIIDYIRALGVSPLPFDVVIGLLPPGASPCKPTVGCSNLTDTVWLEDTSVPVLAHEVGHIYALKDEYCSQQAGGEARCNGANDLNFLGADLGCSPFSGQGCCAGCSGYKSCCQGNLGQAGSGSRCIMSSRGAGVGEQNFCSRCRQRLNGRAEFTCGSMPTATFTSVIGLEMTLRDLETDTKVALNAVEMGRGRASRVTPPGDRFRVTLEAHGTNMLDQQFDVASYDEEASRSTADVSFRVAMDEAEMAAAPMRLTVAEGGEPLFVGQLFSPTDLTLEKRASRDPVFAGTDLTYNLTVRNAGDNPASPVSVVDHLPKGLVYLSSSRDCLEEPVGTITCDLGELAPGQVEEVEITVFVDPRVVFDAGGETTVVNVAAVHSEAEVASPDTDPTNNEAAVTTRVQPRAMNISAARVGVHGRSGRIRVEGDFLTEPGEGDILDTRRIVALRVIDSHALDAVLTWDAGSCQQSGRKGPTACDKVIQHSRSWARFFPTPPVAELFRTTFVLRSLDISPPFIGPLRVLLLYEKGVRLGVIDECRTTIGAGVRCREP